MWAGNMDFVIRCPLATIEEVPSLSPLASQVQGNNPQKTKIA
jgi:hypothetical protein